jgi:exopolysaccharide biosynthesis predicted pyruvyltransferase EpsI
MKFEKFLINNKNQKIYIDPCKGNNGDALIILGLDLLIEKIGSIKVNSPDDADLIIINGGGMFIDAYSQGINKILHYSKLYPLTHLCVAPNSFFFNEVNFEGILALRCAKITLFSREKYSRGYIDEIAKGNSLIESYIDHDLAFHLQGGAFIEKLLIKYPKSDHGRVLVVDRMDLEHSSSMGKISIAKKLYMKFIPNHIGSLIRSLRLYKRKRFGTKLTRDAVKIIRSINPEYKFVNVVTSDVSRVDISSFDEFIEDVANSEYIFTNRLHVGILGFLLDKNVYMVEGSYFKVTGIYEYSMSESNKTHLVTRMIS